MHLYDHLKARKLIHQSMRDYLNYIQTTCDSLDLCGHPIQEMQWILIILNGVRGQFGNVISVIHDNRNLYDITYVSSVLLDAEVR